MTVFISPCKSAASITWTVMLMDMAGAMSDRTWAAAEQGR